jgi:hypothetical protein
MFALPSAPLSASPLERVASRWRFIEEGRRRCTSIHERLRKVHQLIEPILSPAAAEATLPAPEAFAWAGAIAVVALPASLRVRLPVAATAFIPGLVRRPEWQARIGAIFRRSIWLARPPRFETVERNGLPCVSGADGDRFGHLVALAHELGHCLHDERHDYRTAAGFLRSELSAVLFEDAAVRAALPLVAAPGAAGDWDRYQGLCDRVTSFFSALESQEILAGPPDPGRLPAAAFLAARRSYVERIGMQWVYAFATARRRVLGLPFRGRPLEDLLDAAEKGWPVP